MLLVSFFASNTNGSQIDLQSYQHNAFQLLRNFLGPCRDHLDGNNSHQKQVHTLSIIDHQVRDRKRTWEMDSRGGRATYHMHCMSWRLLCWSPSFVNNTAVLSASPTFTGQEKRVQCKKGSKYNTKKLQHSLFRQVLESFYYCLHQHFELTLPLHQIHALPLFPNYMLEN